MKKFFNTRHIDDLNECTRLYCKVFGSEWWFIPLVTYYKKKALHGMFLMGHKNSSVENLRKIEIEIVEEQWEKYKEQ